MNIKFRYHYYADLMQVRTLYLPKKKSYVFFYILSDLLAVLVHSSGLLK